MPDYTSESNSSVDSMLGAFFGNVSQRAFGSMGRHIDGLEDKFRRLNSAASSGFGTLRAGADRVGDAIAGINRGLREQADRIRNMPRLRQPQTTTGPRTRHDERDPVTGRYIPRRRGWGWGGGDGFGTRFGSRFSPGGGLGGISAFGGLGSIGVLFGGASAARGFGRFDANLATLQAEAGLDAEQRRDVTGQILDIAGSTQFDTQQVSSTLIAMVKDGIALTDALNQVPNVLKLAVAESTDLESAWSAMRGFVQSTNSSWEDSVRLSDMMSNATSLSAAKLRDLQDVASRGLTAHSSLEAFSTEGFLAITGILKSLNISNEVIGTGMRQFGTTIARATEGGLTPAAMEALQARGIQFERGMTEVDALKEIQAGVEGMADTELKNFFHEVFGERAKKVFENIIPKVDELEQKMELIRKKGTVNEKFEVHAKSLTNQFKLLTSAADSLIKKFMMILNEGNAFGGGIGWVTEKITQLTAFMEANKDTIQAWWGNFQEIMGGLFNLVATGVEKVSGFWAGLGEGEKTILAIGAVLGAFVLGPVTGLIAAGALIIAKWDEIKDFFGKLWDDMDTPVMGFISTVRDGTMGVINWTRRQWDEMSPYFEKVFRGVGFVVKNAWKVISGAAGVAWEFIKIVWQPVSAWYRLLWEGVKLSATLAWESIKVVIKGVVLFVEGAWNTLKAIFNWEPVKVVRSAFGKLIGFFGNLIGKLKQPFQDFMNFVAGIFNKVADGIEKIRGWFSRGEDGKMMVTVEVEEPEPLKMDADAPKLKGVSEDMKNLSPEQFFQKQKVDAFFKETLPPAVAQTLSNMAKTMLTRQVSKLSKPAESEYYETKAVKAPAVTGPEKPQASYQAFLASEAEARKADEARRVDAGLGKLEKRTVQRSEVREFATEVNRSYISRADLAELKADAETMAMRRDETQRFGVDRQSVLAEAHTFGDRRADLSRVKVFDKLQREFPKLFERFYGADKEKTPVVPEAVLSGDEYAFTQWTEKLTGRMERQEAREKTPSTYTALGGLDKGGITADKHLNRERDQKQALETLEATRVIRFPKLDDEQYREMSQMFRAGFLSLVDIASAQLSEMQTQTRLMGGTVDTSKPVIRQLGDAVFDDEIANRWRAIQEMSQRGVKDVGMPAASEPPKTIEPKTIDSQRPSDIQKPITANVSVDASKAAIRQPDDIQKPVTAAVSDTPSQKPLPKAITDTQADMSPPTVESPVSRRDVESAAAPHAPVLASQSPDQENKKSKAAQGPLDNKMQLPALDALIIQPEIQEIIASNAPVIQPNFEDVVAQHVTIIEPEINTNFEALLEQMRLSEGGEREGGRVTATGQRVEVGKSEKANVTNNITINIVPTEGMDTEQIANEVLAKLEDKMRETNY